MRRVRAKVHEVIQPEGFPDWHDVAIPRPLQPNGDCARDHVGIFEAEPAQAMPTMDAFQSSIR